MTLLDRCQLKLDKLIEVSGLLCYSTSISLTNKKDMASFRCACSWLLCHGAALGLFRFVEILEIPLQTHKPRPKKHPQIRKKIPNPKEPTPPQTNKQANNPPPKKNFLVKLGEWLGPTSIYSELCLELDNFFSLPITVNGISFVPDGWWAWLSFQISSFLCPSHPGFQHLLKSEP